jgi:hypothetical protein
LKKVSLVIMDHGRIKNNLLGVIIWVSKDYVERKIQHPTLKCFFL